MSSEIKKRKYQGLEGPIEERFDVKAIILPFSLMLGKSEEYIYNGGEKIPFNERHPIYRELFLSEFKINMER